MEQPKRKNNIPPQQILKLLSLVKQNRLILNPPGEEGSNDAVKKRELWRAISSEVNASDPLFDQRTPEELRKKWNDMRHLAMKYIRTTLCDGEPPPKKPPYFEQVMDIISEKKGQSLSVPRMILYLDDFSSSEGEPNPSAPATTINESFHDKPQKSEPVLALSSPNSNSNTEPSPSTSAGQSPCGKEGLQSMTESSPLILNSYSVPGHSEEELAALGRRRNKRKLSEAEKEEQEAWIAYLKAKTEESRAKLRNLDLQAEVLRRQLGIN